MIKPFKITDRDIEAREKLDDARQATNAAKWVLNCAKGRHDSSIHAKERNFVHAMKDELEAGIAVHGAFACRS